MHENSSADDFHGVKSDRERERDRLTSALVLFWRWRYAKHVTGASVTTSPLCFVLFV